MALPISGKRIARPMVAGMEGMWTKMWDPPQDDPVTPELVAATNPVPAFMETAVFGFDHTIPNTVSRTLLSTLAIPTWDGAKTLSFMTFEDPDLHAPFNGPHFPGPTIRVPRGVIFHGWTQAKGPPPHTIHWHGIEPTPMNDGVGHCSAELGKYTYQWQPNFIGTYFYHCHRNTVQHFEFGLYGMILVEPPNAYDNPATAGGYPRRTAANLSGFPQFPGFTGGDPQFGVGNAADNDVGDPEAFTVSYDVEALWVLDDRDSNWSDLASDAKAFYPGGSNTADGPDAVTPIQPGVDDQFPKGFFHDFRADYWFVTGVPVPAPLGGVGTIDPEGSAPIGGGLPGGTIPAALNSGVEGMQVAVEAAVGQTVLVRVLNAAYNTVELTFPVDVVIIAWDGRSLGVPPFGRYNHAYSVPAGQKVRFSTARRFDALIRSNNPVSSFAEAKFFDGSGYNPESPGTPLVTARIPINITN